MADIIATAKQLKKEMDAAYKVLKKTPNTENTHLWTTAMRAYHDFCIKTITDIVDVANAESAKKEEVLSKIEEYKTCKQCGKTLIYLHDKENYVASLDLVEYFPGWCMDCLLAHCEKTDCKKCTVSPDHEKCTFYEVKKLHSKVD